MNFMNIVTLWKISLVSNNLNLPNIYYVVFPNDLWNNLLKVPYKGELTIVSFVYFFLLCKGNMNLKSTTIG